MAGLHSMLRLVPSPSRRVAASAAAMPVRQAEAVRAPQEAQVPAEAPARAPAETPTDTVMKDVMALRARLEGAQQELSALRARAARAKANPVLPARAFASALAEALRQPGGTDATIVRIELANMEEIADIYGDEIAAEVVRKVGRWMTAHIRSTDIAGRVGSGTLAVYFRTGELTDLSAKIDRLLRKISRRPLNVDTHEIWTELNFELRSLGAPAKTDGPAKTGPLLLDDPLPEYACAS